MNMEKEGHGWFSVRLEKVGNGIEAVLTGDHFDVEESEVAGAISALESKNSIIDRGSPVYLISDSVARIAATVARRAVRSDLCGCMRGSNGSQCGECEECDAVRRRSFTSSVLGAMKLPAGDLSDRVHEAVTSVLGLVCLDAPYECAMTDGEVDDIFEEMKVKRREEDKDDTHRDEERA